MKNPFLHNSIDTLCSGMGMRYRRSICSAFARTQWNDRHSWYNQLWLFYCIDSVLTWEGSVCGASGERGEVDELHSGNQSV